MLTPSDAFGAIKTLYPNTTEISKGAGVNVLVFSGGIFGFTLYGVDVEWGDVESFSIILVAEITLAKNHHGYYLRDPKNGYLHSNCKFYGSTFSDHKKFTGYFDSLVKAVQTAKKYNPEIKVIAGDVQ